MKLCEQDLLGSGGEGIMSFFSVTLFKLNLPMTDIRRNVEGEEGGGHYEKKNWLTKFVKSGIEGIPGIINKLLLSFILFWIWDHL